jgi:alpha-tubulin suppressor-like RCC1 family protein
VDKDGNVQVWGDNSQNQLGQVAAGLSDDKNYSTPVQLPIMTGAVSVAAGDYFSAALTEKGFVYLWGNGTSDTPAVPKMQSGLGDVVQISACQDKIAALKNDGTVYAWVRGESPERVSGLENIAAISVGGDFSLALEQTGDVWTWNEDAAEKVSEMYDVAAIAAGHTHALAIKNDASVWAWGDNANGQLGTQTPERITVPSKIVGIRSAHAIYAGNRTTAVIASDNKVYTFGYGEYGQLGNGSGVYSQYSPSAISFISQSQGFYGSGDAKVISAFAFGQHHALAVDTQGNLYSWGRDSKGQLGLGGNENKTSPQQLSTKVKGMQPTQFDTDLFSGAADWAIAGSSGFVYGDGLGSLYESGLAPMRVFSRFSEEITREEFAYAVVALYDQFNKNVKVEAKDHKFRDINNSSYKDYILKAYYLGIVNGRSNESFAPSESISRQDAATMADRFINVMLNQMKVGSSDSSAAEQIYADGARIAEYARAAVVNLYNDNIMVGSGGLFSPLSQITRQEVLMILQRTVLKYNFAKN